MRMRDLIETFSARLLHSNAILVSVQASQGSVPREVGAWMAVFADAALGTVGGGRLELDALAHARAMLHDPSLPAVQHYALGPSLGQCCGGRVTLAFEFLSAHDLRTLTQRLQTLQPPPMPVALFGSGHVGTALVRVLSLLPMRLTWIDSRDQSFPGDTPAGVQCEHSSPVQGAVPQLTPQSRVLVMSFSHAEDFAIVNACLLRQRQHGDLPFVGLIGSKTKWATFSRRLQNKGFSAAELAHVTCPIGLPGIRDKRPEVIAALVAAQLLFTLAP
jgi:xanthine dehydrogenase accessory factor